jgi:threonine dehydratase
MALVPASGAGLACGTALALPNTRVFAVEPQEHNDIARSLEAGALQANAPGVRSICDALLVERMGEITFPLAQRVLAGAVSVDDDTIRRALRFAFQHLRLVLEPSGAAALAALLERKIDAPGKTIAIIASGGNVDAENYAKLIAD